MKSSKKKIIYCFAVIVSLIVLFCLALYLKSVSDYKQAVNDIVFEKIMHPIAVLILVYRRYLYTLLFICFAALLGIFIMIKLILIKDYSIILKVDTLAHNSVKLV